MNDLQYKLLIFDFDGTLAITHKGIISCILKTFTTFGVSLPHEWDIQATIGISLGEAFKILYPELEDSQVPNWVETYRRFYRTDGEQQLDLYPGTQELLDFALKADCVLTVLSNKHIDFVNSFLKKLGIHPYFQLIIGDNGKIKKKPDPSLYYSEIQPIFPEIKQHQVLMIGDSTADLLFAENVQIDACWAAYGYGNPTQCLALKPTHIIHEISELSVILQG